MEIDEAFATHRLNEQGTALARDIGAEFHDLLMYLNDNCIHGRELALARTHLETACFFAKKAMAINPDNQVL